METFLKYLPIFPAGVAAYMLFRTVVLDIRAMNSAAKDAGTTPFWKRPVSIVAILVVLAWIPFLISIFRPQAENEIFAPFEKEFHANEAALGKPISRAEPAFINKDNRLGAVQVVTEYAIVLWLDYPGYIFAIPKDPSKHDHVVFAADSVYGAAWTLIPSEVRARKPFQSMPSSCKLPNGGIIEHWYENPEEWGWIGCSEWIVALNAKQIFSQEFEHGLITGPWLVTPDRDAGEIYTIRWTDKKWSSSRSSGTSAEILDFE
jgi:hypothetical protein